MIIISFNNSYAYCAELPQNNPDNYKDNPAIRKLLDDEGFKLNINCNEAKKLYGTPKGYGKREIGWEKVLCIFGSIKELAKTKAFIQKSVIPHFRKKFIAKYGQPYGYTRVFLNDPMRYYIKYDNKYVEFTVRFDVFEINQFAVVYSVEDMTEYVNKSIIDMKKGQKQLKELDKLF